MLFTLRKGRFHFEGAIYSASTHCWCFELKEAEVASYSQCSSALLNVCCAGSCASHLLPHFSEPQRVCSICNHMLLVKSLSFPKACLQKLSSSHLWHLAGRFIPPLCLFGLVKIIKNLYRAFANSRSDYVCIEFRVQPSIWRYAKGKGATLEIPPRYMHSVFCFLYTAWWFYT